MGSRRSRQRVPLVHEMVGGLPGVLNHLSACNVQSKAPEDLIHHELFVVGRAQQRPLLHAQGRTPLIWNV